MTQWFTVNSSEADCKVCECLSVYESARFTWHLTIGNSVKPIMQQRIDSSATRDYAHQSHVKERALHKNLVLYALSKLSHVTHLAINSLLLQSFLVFSYCMYYTWASPVTPNVWKKSFFFKWSVDIWNNILTWKQLCVMLWEKIEMKFQFLFVGNRENLFIPQGANFSYRLAQAVALNTDTEETLYCSVWKKHVFSYHFVQVVFFFKVK